MNQNSSAASGPVNLSPDEIRHVQMVLKKMGFDVGEADGVLAPSTRNALLAFQREHGLEPTGKIDQRTITALELSNQADSTTRGSALSAAGVTVRAPTLRCKRRTRACRHRLDTGSRGLPICRPMFNVTSSSIHRPPRHSHKSRLPINVRGPGVCRL